MAKNAKVVKCDPQMALNSGKNLSDRGGGAIGLVGGRERKKKKTTVTHTQSVQLPASRIRAVDSQLA